ncbi:hypothetical protein [Nocardia seriolae]|uniref:Uncharacterized protein n=1 Tax=Nocardia seriolae TaxID=37332 RepID=A0ABC9Z4R5_9NOCA|nr:hypothetical protein [Nocardia seriolae]BEK92527.1 hypothetical protein NSER024013_04330 [Nocardia seriolae]GAM50468.1 hypothetical protein NS07_v2contig00154-0011 [Nocardia seriolae]GAP32436.1 hypothetical protein NSK11_contig00158-0007 [Nocardia seriolae]
MRSYQVAAETITALVTATVAGLALALPIDFGWTSQTSALQLDLLAYSLPRAIAAGVLVAMIAPVLLTTLGSTKAAWGTTVGGLLVLLANHGLGHATDPHSSLSTMNFIDSLAGGLVLGALGAAVLHHRLPAFAWTLGILISLLLGSVNPVPRVGGSIDETTAGHWHATDIPPVWMILLALALAAFGFLTYRNRPVAQRLSIELPLAPILAGVVLVLVALASAEWLARHGDTLAGIGLAVVTAVGTALIAAMLLPGRDGEIVLLAVGLSAVAAATVAAELPAWSIPLLVAVTAFGMWTGSRYGAPRACLVAAIVLGFSTALTSDTELAWLIVGGAAIVSWLVGFGLASARPRYVPSRVLGTMVIFVPSAVLGMRDYVARGHYALQSPDHSAVCTVTSGSTETPAWTAVLVAAGCLAGLLALRRSRPLPAATEAATDSNAATAD